MSSTSDNVSSGCAGLITTPARQSCLLIRCSVRFKCRQASWCTEIQSTPASANAGMNSSGFSIIRWQSSGNFVALRSDFTTGGPIVRFGTKCPSMMSTWMTLAPPSPAARTCSPSRTKSAERIDGASSIKRELSEPEDRDMTCRNSITRPSVARAPIYNKSGRDCASSRIQRGRVRGDRRHVVDGQFCDDGFHRKNCRSSARTVLNIVELTHDITWRTACKCRHLAMAFQIAAMTGCAAKSLAGVSGHERFAFLDATRRDVGDERGVVVTQFGALQAFRRLNNALADRLHLATIRRYQHPARHVCLGHGVGFNPAHPWSRFQSGEIVGGGPYFLSVCLGFIRNHCAGRRVSRFRALAQTALEIGQLLNDVGHR